MPQIIPIKDLKNTSEISEGQVESGQVNISGLQISMIIELVIWCPGIFCNARIVSLLRKNQVHIFRYDVIMNVQILKELYRWTVANIAIHK